MAADAKPTDDVLGQRLVSEVLDATGCGRLDQARWRYTLTFSGRMARVPSCEGGRRS
jgi:hypothetical protein